MPKMARKSPPHHSRIKSRAEDEYVSAGKAWSSMPWGLLRTRGSNAMLSRLTTTAARRFRGLAWCCAVLGSTVVAQQAALAQDVPLVCVVAVDVDTGYVRDIADLPGGG